TLPLSPTSHTHTPAHTHTHTYKHTPTPTPAHGHALFIQCCVLSLPLALSPRPFLDMVYNALDCTEDDYHALFVLCLLYAMSHSKGIGLQSSHTHTHTHTHTHKHTNTHTHPHTPTHTHTVMERYPLSTSADAHNFPTKLHTPPHSGEYFKRLDFGPADLGKQKKVSLLMHFFFF